MRGVGRWHPWRSGGRLRLPERPLKQVVRAPQPTMLPMQLHRLVLERRRPLLEVGQNLVVPGVGGLHDGLGFGFGLRHAPDGLLGRSPQDGSGLCLGVGDDGPGPMIGLLKNRLLPLPRPVDEFGGNLLGRLERRLIRRGSSATSSSSLRPPASAS